MSFNCKGLKRSLEGVRSLCNRGDIVALQETWLLPHDIPLLGTISDDFSYTGKSAVDTSVGILRGRPYGGVAILWRKNAFSSVTFLDCDNDRLIACKFMINSECSVLIICVYMPTESTENLIEFTQCLSEIYAIIDGSETESVIILGDFNAHPGGLFYKELMDFSEEQQWRCADIEHLGLNSGTYTFISDSHGCFRWLDHCITTKLNSNIIVKVNIQYDVFWSDHFPMEIECNFSLVRYKTKLKMHTPNKIIWGDRTLNKLTITVLHVIIA
ncbi:uncharacterized protein LOC131842822 [Achroia grisella]|uniref:uncharacterized protein LOC131842822 n=1 Tax=Achroia grisella TaxID=688607 RepID=UPI0027D20FE3|nr:uncharacterized protein LOC131842822 [Achroia grisella]